MPDTRRQSDDRLRLTRWRGGSLARLISPRCSGPPGRPFRIRVGDVGRRRSTSPSPWLWRCRPPSSSSSVRGETPPVRSRLAVAHGRSDDGQSWNGDGGCAAAARRCGRKISLQLTKRPAAAAGFMPALATSRPSPESEERGVRRPPPPSAFAGRRGSSHDCAGAHARRCRLRSCARPSPEPSAASRADGRAPVVVVRQRLALSSCWRQAQCTRRRSIGRQAAGRGSDRV